MMSDAQHDWERDFVGGAAAFDFVNMAGRWQAAAMVDGWETVENPLAWGRRSGLLSGATASRLSDAVQQEPRLAVRIVTMAEDLRGAVSEIGAALADRREPAAADLATLKDYYHRSIAVAELVHDTQLDYGFDFSQAPHEFVLIGPLATSAMDILSGTDKSRIKRCPECGWLFIDNSKNRSRRWCDMATCGNRTKGRRHRAQKAQAPPERAARGFVS